jgi:hypothetical protein
VISARLSLASGAVSQQARLVGLPTQAESMQKPQLKTFPECKGGEIEEAADEKDKKK